MLKKSTHVITCLLLTFLNCNAYANELENQTLNAEKKQEITFDDGSGDEDDEKQQKEMNAKTIKSTEQKPIKIRAIK